MFTPEDIENVKLRRALLGGYNVGKTKQLLRQIAWDLSRVLHERGSFEEDARRFRAQLLRYERREELESASLGAAHEAARKIRGEARRDAELILRKAYRQASAIREAAENEAASRVAEFTALERQSRIMRTGLRSMLTSVLEGLGEPVADARKHEQRPLTEDLERAVRDRAATVQHMPDLQPEQTERDDDVPSEDERELATRHSEGPTGDERVA